MNPPANAVFQACLIVHLGGQDESFRNSDLNDNEYHSQLSPAIIITLT